MTTDPTRETILTYEGIAEYYATIEDDPELRSYLRGLLGEPKDHPRILEVGCGPGIDAGALQARGFDVTGIDLCEAFINRAQMRYPEVDFRLMDMRAPQFDDASFDGILSLASLIHVLPEDVPATIERYRLLLRPGGRLVIWASDSPMVEYYDVPDWGGASSRYLRMWCHDRTMVTQAMQQAGFDQHRVVQLQSDYYAGMQRIQDNQVALYVAVGTLDG
ncbi:MAG: class I SAM-dependent methyltransferase [Phycisphaerales bacterium]|nr:class I SAM-dependent methyltransferase [Phycisphaerales bacterium]